MHGATVTTRPTPLQGSRAQLPVVVNIGCAEGYYGIGLASRLPGVPVHAYDTPDTLSISSRASWRTSPSSATCRS